MKTHITYYNKDTEPIAGIPYDFNNNEKIDSEPVQCDLNKDGLPNILTSYNDWDILKLRCGRIGTRFNDSTAGLSELKFDSKDLPTELTYNEYIRNIQPNEN